LSSCRERARLGEKTLNFSKNRYPHHQKKKRSPAKALRVPKKEEASFHGKKKETCTPPSQRRNKYETSPAKKGIPAPLDAKEKRRRHSLAHPLNESKLDFSRKGGGRLTRPSERRKTPLRKCLETVRGSKGPGSCGSGKVSIP